jgi:hypothetical protein
MSPSPLLRDQSDQEAAERGRLMTAHGMAVDSEGRARLEAAYGIEYCRNRYPEAYKSGFSRMLDNLRAKIPW